MIHFQEINEVNVFTAWRQLLEENEKISKARLAAVQVLILRKFEYVLKLVLFEFIHKNFQSSKHYIEINIKKIFKRIF